MDNDRRIFDRFQARFPIKFKDSRADFGQEVFLRDASASGAHIVARERMFFNDRISLEIELPDYPQPMTLNGRVVWVKPAGADRSVGAGGNLWDIGFQFDDINFMKLQRLFKFTLAS